MSRTFLDLSNSLVNTFVFTCRKFMMHFVLSWSLLLISTSSAISLFFSFVYPRELPIRNVGFRVLFFVESLQTLFDGLTISMSNLCQTESQITSSSIFGVNSIRLTVLGSSLVRMDSKAKVNMEYLDFDHTLLKIQKTW